MKINKFLDSVFKGDADPIEYLKEVDAIQVNANYLSIFLTALEARIKEVDNEVPDDRTLLVRLLTVQEMSNSDVVEKDKQDVSKYSIDEKKQLRNRLWAPIGRGLQRLIELRETLVNGEPRIAYDKYSSQIRFKSSFITIIYDLLENYFNEDARKSLLNLLKEGNKLEEPILFEGRYGNQIADAFKQLYDAGIITGCTKDELEKWILHNFIYKDNDEIKRFKPKGLKSIVSSNNSIRNPIIDVKKVNGEYTITKT